MKIVLTGAGGMLGSAISELFQPHFEMTGLDLTPKSHLTIPCQVCDLGNEAQTREIILAIKPSWIIHTAAMTQVDDCEIEKERALRNNFQATQNLVHAANDSGAILMFFSTDYVFDGTKLGEYTEEDPTAPANFYGETKLLAENYIRQHAKRYLIIRISWLFGRRGNSFPKAILKLAEKQSEIKVVFDQVGRPTYTKDLACAILEVIKKTDQLKAHGLNEIYNITNQGQTSWYDYARFILDHTQRQAVKVVPIPSTELDRKAKRPANSVLSLKKAETDLGVKLRPWQEAVFDYIKSSLD